MFACIYANCPIVCNVTDFGFSRSLNIQTQSILQSWTEDVGCATPVYMALDIHHNTLKVKPRGFDHLRNSDMPIKHDGRSYVGKFLGKSSLILLTQRMEKAWKVLKMLFRSHR
jgi:hypothetical protein